MKRWFPCLGREWITRKQAFAHMFDGGTIYAVQHYQSGKRMFYISLACGIDLFCVIVKIATPQTNTLSIEYLDIKKVRGLLGKVHDWRFTKLSQSESRHIERLMKGVYDDRT